MRKSETSPHAFTVTGTFNVHKSLIPQLSSDQQITSFVLADGREVRLIVALEVQSADGSNYEYVTSDYEMKELGFGITDYDRTDFEESADDN